MAVDTTTALQGLETARAKIAGVIKSAADVTGASFGYLVAAAKMESNLNPAAAASTSSARVNSVASPKIASKLRRTYASG